MKSESIRNQINVFISLRSLINLLLLEALIVLLILLLKELDLTITPLFSLTEKDVDYATVIGVTITSYSIILGFALNRFMKLETILGVGAFKYVTKHTLIQLILTLMVSILIILTSGLFLDVILPKEHIVSYTWRYIAFAVICFSYAISAPMFILAFLNPLSHRPLNKFVKCLKEKDLLQFKFQNGIINSQDVENNEFYILKKIIIHLYKSNRGVLAEDLCSLLSENFSENITPGFNEKTNKLLIARKCFLESLCRDSQDQLTSGERSRSIRAAFLVFLEMYRKATSVDYQYNTTLHYSDIWKYICF